MSTYAMRSKSDRRRVKEDINHRVDKINVIVELVGTLKSLKSQQRRASKVIVDYNANSVEYKALSKALDLLCTEIDVIESELTWMYEEMPD
jgi:hypothetical protein